MKNDGWVRWTQWGDHGIIGFGQMPLKNVAQEIRRFGEQAAKVLKETGADHVVYAIKEYEDDGDLYEVKFYMLAMSDEDFQKRVATLKGVTVYAVHKGVAA